jgi:sulfatase modifying factor 1
VRTSPSLSDWPTIIRMHRDISCYLFRLVSIIAGSTLYCQCTTVTQAESPPHAVSPAGMKWIPPGEFVMGTEDEASMPNERPSHKVKLDGFWMDEHLVTNAEFDTFVVATKYVTTAELPVSWEELKKQLPPGTEKPPAENLLPGSLVFTPPEHAVDTRDLSGWWTWTTGASWKHPDGPGSSISGKENDPVVQISWDDAVQYAKWAKKRLPTEAEWEYAARGGAKRNTRFWWGDEFRPEGKWMANTFNGSFPYNNTKEDGFPGRSPVKAFPSNGYGLYDMAGNVWQWTADLYRVDVHRTLASELSSSGRPFHINPQGPTDSFNPTRALPGAHERVIKGGSFLCHKSYCESYRPTARRGTPPDTGSGHVGFRCVVSAKSGKK